MPHFAFLGDPCDAGTSDRHAYIAGDIAVVAGSRSDLTACCKMGRADPFYASTRGGWLAATLTILPKINDRLARRGHGLLTDEPTRGHFNDRCSIFPCRYPKRGIQTCCGPPSAPVRHHVGRFLHPCPRNQLACLARRTTRRNPTLDPRSILSRLRGLPLLSDPRPCPDPAGDPAA